MKLSCVIPYMESDLGKPAILERCLDSLAGVDEILVMENWKEGYAVPINAGMELSTGDFILVSTDDVIWDGMSLKRLCDPEAVTSPIVNGREQPFWGVGFCLPRWVYEQTGGLFEGYRISYFDDDDFIKTLEKAGIPMHSVPSVSLQHPEGGRTLHTFPDHDAFFAENQALFKTMEPLITVITPTVRPEGIALVAKALKRQTQRAFEWLIVAPMPVLAKLPLNIPAELIEEPKKAEGDVWALNKAYNAAIRRAKGELIVSWQDFTFANPEALAKYWFHYGQEPETVVTGVGHKYEDDSWLVRTWQDPRARADQGTFYPCYFNDIEFNFCALPRAALFAVGGFDERLDRCFGLDGYSVVDRLNLLGGWDFKIDQTNESFALEHSRPPRWEELNALHGPYAKRRETYLANPVLPYLA